MGRLAVTLLASLASLSAEQGVLVLQVKDIHERAIKQLQLQAEGSAVSAPTDDSGLARIRLSPLTKQGTWVAVRLVNVVDPIFWTEKRPFLRWWVALKIEESQCPKPARVIRPA